MTWYDFNLYVIKHQRIIELKLQDFETGWDQTRQLWALLASGFSGKQHLPTELVRLSYDGEQHQAEPMTKEKMEELRKRFGSTIKKKNG